MKIFLSRLKSRGLGRRIAVTIYMVLIAGVGMWIAASAYPPLVSAIIILVVSIIAFTILGIWTSDATLAWRFVDYPWILAAVVTLAASVTNIETAVQSAEDVTLDRLSNIVNATSVLSDIEDWGGVCSDLSRSLGAKNPIDIKFDYSPYIKPLGSRYQNTLATQLAEHSFNPCATSELQYLADNMSKRLLDRDKLANYISDNRQLLYLFNISCYIPNIEEQLDRIFNPPSAHMDYNAGDLADSYISKYHQFCKTISHLDVSMRDPLDTLEQLANIKHSNMLTWALQEPWRIRWWYFILAFFVGLRLGKVTAEINASLRRTN